MGVYKYVSIQPAVGGPDALTVFQLALVQATRDSQNPRDLNLVLRTLQSRLNPLLLLIQAIRERLAPERFQKLVLLLKRYYGTPLFHLQSDQAGHTPLHEVLYGCRGSNYEDALLRAGADPLQALRDGSRFEIHPDNLAKSSVLQAFIERSRRPEAMVDADFVPVPWQVGDTVVMVVDYKDQAGRPLICEVQDLGESLLRFGAHEGILASLAPSVDPQHRLTTSAPLPRRTTSESFRALFPTQTDFRQQLPKSTTPRFEYVYTASPRATEDGDVRVFGYQWPKGMQRLLLAQTRYGVNPVEFDPAHMLYPNVPVLAQCFNGVEAKRYFPGFPNPDSKFLVPGQEFACPTVVVKPQDSCQSNVKFVERSHPRNPALTRNHMQSAGRTKFGVEETDQRGNSISDYTNRAVVAVQETPQGRWVRVIACYQREPELVSLPPEIGQRFEYVYAGVFATLATTLRDFCPERYLDRLSQSPNVSLKTLCFALYGTQNVAYEYRSYKVGSQQILVPDLTMAYKVALKRAFSMVSDQFKQWGAEQPTSDREVQIQTAYQYLEELFNRLLFCVHQLIFDAGEYLKATFGKNTTQLSPEQKAYLAHLEGHLKEIYNAVMVSDAPPFIKAIVGKYWEFHLMHFEVAMAPLAKYPPSVKTALSDCLKRGLQMPGFRLTNAMRKKMESFNAL